jgi:processive 1,2-diacylglycerol beta-glucosyltransferase
MEGSLYLQHWGVPAADTFATGIPIHPVFSKPKDRQACLTNHGLADDRPVILQLSGGFGVGPIEKIFHGLLSVEQPIQLVTITGRNEKLKGQLARIKTPARHAVKIMGFTKEIDELMQAADLVVSKPGGLTTSEVLARGAVMVIVNPIPGQESRNSDYLLENGAAIKANNLATLGYKVNALLKDADRLEQLRGNVRRIARPRSAFDVVEKSLALLAGR